MKAKFEISERQLNSIVRTVSGKRVRKLKFHVIQSKKSLAVHRWIIGEMFDYDPLKDKEAIVIEMWELDGTHPIDPALNLDLVYKNPAPKQTTFIVELLSSKK